MKIQITSDSTCDLSAENVAKYGVEIMPLTVHLGIDSYQDGVDITPQDIFNYVAKSGELPKTSACSIEEYREYFEKILEKTGADCIIHFNISSKASVSNSNANRAAETFNKKVRVIDSMALSAGQGALVLKACDLMQEGKTADEIVEIINELRLKVNTSFVPDALDYLHKGGRCSLAALMGAKILRLHPMIEMVDGKLSATKKFKGDMTRCISSYIKDLREKFPEYDKTRCFITHTGCESEVVEYALRLVNENFEFDEVIVDTAGSIVTAHCGKGTLGVLFIAK